MPSLVVTLVQVVQWIDEGAMGAEHNEGADIKVGGRVQCRVQWRVQSDSGL